MSTVKDSRSRTINSSPQEKSILKIFLELVYFTVLLVPNILIGILKRFWPPESKSLDGKVVLVTQSGAGLGRELALGFAHFGAVVACVDADHQASLETAEEIVRDGEKARAYCKDVTRPEEVAELRVAVSKDLGPVDILVINCSSFHCQAVENITEPAVRAALEGNFLTHVWMVNEFLPEMKQRGGHIVSVNSLAGVSPLAGASVYAGSCWAVNGFMESVRLEILLEGLKNIHFTLVNAAILDNSLSKCYSLNALQRLATRSRDVVAAAVITSVRRNQVHAYIPQQLYDLCAVSKMLPTPVVDCAFQLLSLRPKTTDKMS